MPGLRDILRAIGSLPGRLEGAMYETEPIFRERRNMGSMRIPGIGGEDEEFTPGTGEMEEVGKRRTGRMSKFGSFVQNQLPEIIRAGVVAAGSPTPGAIGSAQDIFGALKAVGDDRNRRDMLRYQMQRQAEEDAMKRAEFEQGSRLNDARIKDYEAQAAYRSTPRPGSDPTEKVTAMIKLWRERFGEDPPKEYVATWTGAMQPGYVARPQAAPARLSGVISQQMARLDPESPTYQQDYARLESMYKEALEREQGMKFGEGRKPFQRPILAKEIGAWLAAPDKITPGTSIPVVGLEGKPTGPFKRPATQQQTKVTAADRKQTRQEKISAVANALLQEFDGDRAKAAAAAVKDKRAQGLVKEVQDYLVPPQKGKSKPSAEDEMKALAEAITGKKPTTTTNKDEWIDLGNGQRVKRIK